MPFALLLFYRVLGILLWVLVLLMLWEKYRIVRGGTLLPAQILDCCKSSQSDTPAQPSRRGALINPRVGNILAKAKADAAARAGFDKAVHGAGVKSILSVYKGRVQHYIALLGRA